MNLVFAGIQGTAEWIFHRALEAVESVSPAVLWIPPLARRCQLGPSSSQPLPRRWSDEYLTSHVPPSP